MPKEITMNSNLAFLSDEKGRKIVTAAALGVPVEESVK